MGIVNLDLVAASCVLRTAVASLESTIRDVKARTTPRPELVKQELGKLQEWRITQMQRRIAAPGKPLATPEQAHQIASELQRPARRAGSR